MLRVVDADCLVAAAIAGRGAAFELLQLWRDGAFELVACPHLVQEVHKALTDPRIVDKYGVEPAEVEQLARVLREESIWLDDPVDPRRVVGADPGDDYLVALALAAGADSLVSRDRHLDGVLVEDLDIVTPGVALRRLYEEQDDLG